MVERGPTSGGAKTLRVSINERFIKDNKKQNKRR
jgi:hypothetical protein